MRLSLIIYGTKPKQNALYSDITIAHIIPWGMHSFKKKEKRKKDIKVEMVDDVGNGVKSEFWCLENE